MLILLSSLLLAAAPVLAEPTSYIFGSRVEYCEAPSNDPRQLLTFTRFSSKMCRTFNSRLTTRAPLSLELSFDALVLKNSLNLEVKSNKEVPSHLTGLHRNIAYHVSLRLNASYFDIERFKRGECRLSILDLVERGFYIDYEEIDQTKSFTFIENDRMDIEKMNSLAPQYYYILDFSLSDDNTKLSANGISIDISKEIKYHIRYGEANQQGKILYKMDTGFDIASNCIKPESLSDEGQKALKSLSQVPRYQWALTKLFGKEKFWMATVESELKPQEFIIPTGNTNHESVVVISTFAVSLYAVAMVLLALFSSSALISDSIAQVKKAI